MAKIPELHLPNIRGNKTRPTKRKRFILIRRFLHGVTSVTTFDT
jgi:hypothetical protein